MKTFLAVSVACAAVGACGGGGNVDRYATCTTTDVCPSETVCESAVTTQTTQTTAFCTHSCEPATDLSSGSSCANDPSGLAGVCIATGALSDTMGDQYGFCFQECSAGSCPSNETCATISQGVARLAGTSICIPGLPADPLSGTSWQSTTIESIASNEYGVTASNYTVTFASGTLTYDPSANSEESFGASGPFNATFTQTYGAATSQNAGCMEITTFTGGTWGDNTSDETKETVEVTSAVGSTTRTGCTTSTDDVTNLTGVYDNAVNNSPTTFVVSGCTMTLAGGGVTPYQDDTIPWTFTKM